MDVGLRIILILGYNLLLIELLTIAWMAWRYNGQATAGTGKLLGPFAFILASVLLRVDISLFLTSVEVSFSDYAVWRIAGIAQLWGAVVVGGFVCEHMLSRVRELKQ